MDNKSLVKKIVGNNIKSIKEIHQGVSNSSYLVNNQWVVRVKTSKEHFYSYRKEKEILHKTARTYLSECVTYLDKDGNKVSEYIPNVNSFTGKNNEIIEVAKMLKKLHACKEYTHIKFKPFTRFNYYRNNSKAKKFFDHEYMVVAKAKKISKKYPLVICHNDLVDNNLLFTKNRSYLIDYEYAGKNTFLFDLASFITENNIDDKKKINLFLKTYGLSKEKHDELLVFMMFNNLLWYYWALERYSVTKRAIFNAIAKNKKARIELDMRHLKKKPL